MLLDTSGLLNLVHQDEAYHEQSLAYFAVASHPLVHNYIIAEFIALANSRGLSRKATLEFIFDLTNSEEVEVVWVGPERHRQALELLNNRLDKQWSLCDAVSFVVMNERGIAEALTTDKHFEQAGYIRLLD